MTEQKDIEGSEGEIDIISTTADDFKISIGRIFELKDAPNIRNYAQLLKLKGVKSDKWYCPMTISHSSGKTAEVIVFFSPPYSNVGIGLGWLKSSWNQSEVVSSYIDSPVREGLKRLLEIRKAAGEFARLGARPSSGFDIDRVLAAKEKRKKKADRNRRRSSVA